MKFHINRTNQLVIAPSYSGDTAQDDSPTYTIDYAKVLDASWYSLDQVHYDRDPDAIASLARDSMGKTHINCTNNTDFALQIYVPYPLHLLYKLPSDILWHTRDGKRRKYIIRSAGTYDLDFCHTCKIYTTFTPTAVSVLVDGSINKLYCDDCISNKYPSAQIPSLASKYVMMRCDSKNVLFKVVIPIRIFLESVLANRVVDKYCSACRLNKHDGVSSICAGCTAWTRWLVQLHWVICELMIVRDVAKHIHLQMLDYVVDETCMISPMPLYNIYQNLVI